MLYLPPYSSDLNPIEPAFVKVKSLLRRAEAHTKAALDTAIAESLNRFSLANRRNFTSNAGYAHS